MDLAPFWLSLLTPLGALFGLALARRLVRRFTGA